MDGWKIDAHMGARATAGRGEALPTFRESHGPLRTAIEAST